MGWRAADTHPPTTTPMPRPGPPFPFHGLERLGVVPPRGAPGEVLGHGTGTPRCRAPPFEAYRGRGRMMAIRSGRPSHSWGKSPRRFRTQYICPIPNY